MARGRHGRGGTGSASRGEPVEDLVQIARVGLLKAIPRFDSRRDTGFLAFAIPTITGELRRHFRDRTWDVRVPRPLQERNAAIRQAATAISEHPDGGPTVSRLATRLGLTLDEVREGIRAGNAYRAVSLDLPAGSADGATSRSGRCSTRFRFVIGGFCTCASSRNSPRARSGGRSVSPRCRSPDGSRK